MCWICSFIRNFASFWKLKRLKHFMTSWQVLHGHTSMFRNINSLNWIDYLINIKFFFHINIFSFPDYYSIFCSSTVATDSTYFLNFETISHISIFLKIFWNKYILKCIIFIPIYRFFTKKLFFASPEKLALWRMGFYLNYSVDIWTI